jgi:hypothetical protein
MFKSAPEKLETVVEEGAGRLLLSFEESFPKDDPREELPFKRLAELEFKGGKKSTELLPGGGPVVGSKGNEEKTRLDKRLSEENNAEENPRSPATLDTLSLVEGSFSFIKIESMESTRVPEEPLDKVDEGESNNSIKPEFDRSSNPESFNNKDLEDKVSE